MLPWIATRAGRSPDDAALVVGGRIWRWVDLEHAARRRAAALVRHRVGPGDVVAMLVGNDVESVELLHALWIRGAVPLPLNLRLTVAELAALLELARPKVLLHGGGDLAHRAARAVASLEGDGRGIPVLENSPLPEELDHDPGHGPGFARPSSELGVLLATSGTTGRPKLVELETRALAASALASALRLGVDPGDRWYASLPIFHVGGLAIHVRAVLYGMTVVLPKPSPTGAPSTAFEARRFWRELETRGVTVVSLVPTMLVRLLDAELPPPARLRCALVGGGPTPGALIERARAQGWPVVTTYGLTEAGSQVSTGDPEGASPALGAGRALDPTAVAILDDEICVRGPTLMRGYHRDAAASREALRGGWLRTGDQGHLDAAGHLHVLDRRDDLIVSGGENVSPTEVEAVLADHPEVGEVGVRGEADPDLGQRVAAWVVPTSEGQAPELEALRDFARDRLAGFKLPRALYVVEQLPRTASGKLQRAKLGD